MEEGTDKKRRYSRQLIMLSSVFSGGSTEPETSITTIDYQLQFQNSHRQLQLHAFRRDLLVGMNKTRPMLEQEVSRKLGQKCDDYEYIYELARSVTKWIIQRHVMMAEWVRTKQSSGKELIRALDNYHWCLLGMQAHSHDIDQKIWEKYAVAIEGMSEEMPEVGEPNYPEVALMKIKANAYFLAKLHEMISSATLNDLIEATLHITQLSTFMKLFVLLLPQLLQAATTKQFQEDILPKICFYAICHRKSFTGPLLEALLKRCQVNVTADLVNSLMEFSSHSINLNILAFLLDTFKQHVRTEGILCGLLAATIKGNQQLMAIYQFYVVEKLRELYGNDLEVGRFKLDATTNDFLQFVPPFIYVLFAASSDAVHAVINVVSDLIEFYDKDPLKEILADGGITEELHLHFIDGIFNWACKLNHYSAVETLLECNWVKSDFVTPISNAVREGHQKILHLLLESLLSPDPLFELPYGAIPLCFRRNQALKLLPMIANRFPGEATWFINSISNIPVPLAVPPSEDTDPAVKAKMVEGIRLGSANLADVAIVQEATIPHEKVWNKLDRVGQLHKASSRSSGEIESVVCMIPDVLLKEPAVRDGNPSRSLFNKETNSLVRLLATEEEEIILSPVVQSLMEYHWASGHFWLRFGYQFLSMVCFILMSTMVFSNQTNNPLYLYGFTSVIVTLAIMFLLQEVRQYIDDSKEYVKSGSNVIDVLIYTLTITIVAINYFTTIVEFHPLIKALIILFSTMRLLLHLRIFPSVGPIVRITSAALLNVVPILVPMLFLLAAYSAAFFILHQDLIGPNTNFNSFAMSMQYTTTMITFDYT
jgi:hypothetical protein